MIFPNNNQTRFPSPILQAFPRAEAFPAVENFPVDFPQGEAFPWSQSDGNAA